MNPACVLPSHLGQGQSLGQIRPGDSITGALCARLCCPSRLCLSSFSFHWDTGLGTAMPISNKLQKVGAINRERESCYFQKCLETGPSRNIKSSRTPGKPLQEVLWRQDQGTLKLRDRGSSPPESYIIHTLEPLVPPVLYSSPLYMHWLSLTQRVPKNFITV